jgi:hypothetical protein
MELYFPVLRWKQGEREALRNLSQPVLDKIVPIIEFPQNCVPNDRKITTFPQSALSDLGTDKSFYLDISYIDECGISSARLLDDIFTRGLQCIPVHNLQNGRGSLATIIQLFTGRKCRSFAIRVSDNVSDAEIDYTLATLQQYGIAHEELDLILDMRDLCNGAVQAKLRMMRMLTQRLGTAYHRSIVLAGSFTKDAIQSNSQGWVNRYDWALWKETRQSSDLAHVWFGDYTTVICEFRDSEYRGAPSIKYTTDDHWFVMKGNLRERQHPQRIAQSSTVVSAPFYRRQPFSFGDLRIGQCATGVWGPGSTSNWVAIDVSQHIAFAVSQVSAILRVP